MRKKWTGTIVGEMHVYGISQKELAKKLGMSASYVSFILSGERNPRGIKEKMFKACKELVREKMRDAKIDELCEGVSNAEG